MERLEQALQRTYTEKQAIRCSSFPKNKLLTEQNQKTWKEAEGEKKYWNGLLCIIPFIESSINCKTNL